MKQKKKEKIIIQEVKKKIYKKVYKEKEGDERGGGDVRMKVRGK